MEVPIYKAMNQLQKTLRYKKFEISLAKIVSRKYACAVSSGTAALEIVVKSLELKKNDEEWASDDPSIKPSFFTY